MLKDKIEDLKKEKDVVILAHNYQIPEVQDVADFVGDSLGLARQAAKTPHKIILFCGVHFMAETAAIISPEKKVLIPDIAAGCSLSDSITLEQLQQWKKRNGLKPYLFLKKLKINPYINLSNGNIYLLRETKLVSMIINNS